MSNPGATSAGAGGVSATIKTLAYDERKFRTWLRSNHFSGWHGCCSCRMGRADDVEAVVDTRARVYDTKGLRVCDASIFPVKPDGNTQAPCYGIARKLTGLVADEEYDYLLD